MATDTMDENDTLDLPPELRVLVEFFAADARASCILDGDDRLVYGNRSLNNIIDNKGRNDLVRRLRNDRIAIVDGTNDVSVHGRLWRRTRLKNGYTTVVCKDGTHVADTSAAPGQRGSGQGALEALSSLTAVNLDWTHSDLPIASPWVNYVRKFDWASTGVGPMHLWPPQLRQIVVTTMSNPNPRVLIWGEDMTFIYNEASIPLFGSKHPSSLGSNISVSWGEAWPMIGALVHGAYAGNPAKAEQMPVTVMRSNFLEDTYWDFAMIPVMGPGGNAAGLIDEFTEASKLVRSDRRRIALVKMSERLASATTLRELWSNLIAGFEDAKEDIPNALLYSVVDDAQNTIPRDLYPTGSRFASSKSCLLQGKVGIANDTNGLLNDFSLRNQAEDQPGLAKHCFRAWRTQNSAILSSANAGFPEPLAVSDRTEEPVRTAMVKPIRGLPGDDLLAILVLGCSPRSPFDEDYNNWLQLVGDIVEKAASLISLPEEQRRAQRIADEVNAALSMQLHRTTLEAERSESRFRRMAERSPTGIFMFDGEGKAVHVNDAYLEIMSDTREAHTERNAIASEWTERVHPDDVERFKAAWECIAERKTPITLEYRLKRPWKSVDSNTGQELTGETWLLANAFPELESDGSVQSVQGWLTDISHRKFGERLLAQRLDDALEQKRQTNNFIDMTSHEMRNPLSAILQSADAIVSTLGEAGLPMIDENMSISHDTADDLLDAAQTIILCAQHQKRITDDILTLSKLDASLLVIAPDTIQPPALVAKALKMYESEIVRAQIDAKMVVEDSYAQLGVDWVVLDSSRLLQVIINLLTNAIKFTQYSETRRITVCVGASHDRPSGDHHHVRFIPVRHVNRNHEYSSEWGTGEEVYLQIAVCDSGKGLTEDEMNVLFQRFQQASPRTYKQYGGSGLGLFISRELCELQGGQIGVSSSAGKTAFTFFVKVRKYKEKRDSIRPGLPSYTSASASPTIHSRKESYMMDEAPDKSSSQQERGERARSNSNASPITNGLPKATVPYNKALHVLIVEDNAVNQKVMSQQLRKAGCTVHVVNHGLECLAFLEKSSFCGATTSISVVLLDLEMPTMDGLTCIRHIREQERSGKISSHVPVIAVTANARSEQISVALDAGMDRVVTKPFRIPELMPQMRALVAEVEQRGLG